MTALVERFGVAVRQLRVQNGWSQGQLAELSNLDRSYVGEIERGRVIASIVTVEKLAAALQLDVVALLAHCEQLGERRAVQLISLAAIAR
ncbi:helix-turn-helix transcriptional regulator [Variovorax sp. J22G21]|uniref:helix-turn-helix domain-containing protein n=1 Tax=Variovorax fucosicus TaxID=3053517 RepID=UPI0025780BFE|nr:MULTISPECIES: helix-turn-helix transcriptional regulator [unclassified Variovorax]MDM0037668.1 helix-turn-helix transcriptional regulator [Variovorax sp. J22R193]MDM0056663.1 helix-turn-helix transcriptional regulator [Variovorax sp. J22G47]MDM0062444.1 helix-turn-helix transcriptional regulator [Variovorax sp. J22G21]